VLAIACLGVAAAATPASALADLWVSGHGTDTGYCSFANPCATISHALSLLIPNDTIHVDPGTVTDHVTIDPSIVGLTIEGGGASKSTVSGGFDESGAVFRIESGASLTITDLSIVGGQAPNGGGVDDAGTLTMERDTVASNAATGPDAEAQGYGGGVYYTGTITISDSTIAFNQAASGGGGIAPAIDTGTAVPGAVATLTRDLIDRNTVVGSGRADGGVGGGIVDVGRGTYTSDTITGNRIVGTDGSLAGRGGGFAAGGTLISDTIAGNSAATTGGLYSLGDTTVQRTILAANDNGNCGPAGFPRMVIRDDGDNLDADPSNPCGLNPSAHDLIGVDPLLGQLRDNGGPGETLAIPSSSPAYDANASCAGTDQRGAAFLQRGATRCDIGAYQVDAPSTYVANPPAGSVTAYATGASGDAVPVLSVTGPATGLSQPTGVVVDVNGDVFVANAGNNSVTEYAPEVTGNVAPKATIAGAKTRLSQPQDLALDGAGNLFVTNLGSVTEYAAGSLGNVAPIARIAGSRTGLSQPHGIVVDPDGNLRVTTGNATVNTYSAHANGNVAPLSRVTKAAANGLSNPRGLNFDAAGHLVVADAGAGRVDTFDVGASGAAQPLSVLTGAPPVLRAPAGLDLDSQENVFVADSAANTVTEYPTASRGAATPIAQITGSDTGLAGPAFLSELPPPPHPLLRGSSSRRRSRERLLRDGITLRLTASGRLAFRSQPVTVGAVASVHRALLAVAPPRPLRPGTTRVRLTDTQRAARLLRRHRRTRITVVITLRGGFGAQRHRLTVICTG
jgi:hypothetical protein